MYTNDKFFYKPVVEIVCANFVFSGFQKKNDATIHVQIIFYRIECLAKQNPHAYLITIVVEFFVFFRNMCTDSVFSVQATSLET